MGTAEIRQRLHQIIDIAADKKLKAIYTLLEDDASVEDEYEFSAAQKKELDRRWHDHQNGIGKTYTWDETVEVIDKILAGLNK